VILTLRLENIYLIKQARIEKEKARKDAAEQLLNENYEAERMATDDYDVNDYIAGIVDVSGSSEESITGEDQLFDSKSMFESVSESNTRMRRSSTVRGTQNTIFTPIN